MIRRSASFILWIVLCFVLSECTSPRPRPSVRRPPPRRNPEIRPQNPSVPAPVLSEADKAKQRLENNLQQHLYLPAFDDALYLAERTSSQDERRHWLRMAQDLVDSRMTDEDLRQVADRRTPLAAAAKFRFANLLLERQEFDEARRYFSDVVSLNQDADLTDQSTQAMARLSARLQVEPRTIGLVVPLSGKQAAIGQKTLRGIQLGLGLYGKIASPLRLAVIDSEGNPEVARRGIDRLMQEDHVIAIVGGLVSRTASVEVARALEYGVPFIALSQKSGLTQLGETIFRNSLTSQMQVSFLVDVAMQKLGMRRFAIVYPNDPYGVEFANLFWDEVLSRGGSVTAAQTYDPHETDFRGHVQRMVGTYFVDDRLDEYKVQLRQWQEKNPRRTGRQLPPSPEELLRPMIDFDGVFIPDTAKVVSQIAPFLAYSDIDREKVRLLGTNLWNRPGFIELGKRYIDRAVYIDSFSGAEKGLVGTEFYGAYKQLFDEDPGLYELQAYDSALVLRHILSTGENTRSGLTSRLANLKDFPGALGPVSINSGREIVRPLTAFEVKDGRAQPLAR